MAGVSRRLPHWRRRFGGFLKLTGWDVTDGTVSISLSPADGRSYALGPLPGLFPKTM